MKNVFIIFFVILFSCKTNTNQTELITFKVAKNYFVKNTPTGNTIVEKVITSQKEFDEIFGTAARMGDSGLPTAIDFSKEQVIVVMLPVTNTSTEIFPVKIVRVNPDVAEFHYKIKYGERLSHDIKPKLLLSISKEYKIIHFNKED